MSSEQHIDEQVERTLAIAENGVQAVQPDAELHTRIKEQLALPHHLLHMPVRFKRGLRAAALALLILLNALAMLQLMSDGPEDASRMSLEMKPADDIHDFYQSQHEDFIF